MGCLAFLSSENRLICAQSKHKHAMGLFVLNVWWSEGIAGISGYLAYCKSNLSLVKITCESMALLRGLHHGVLVDLGVLVNHKL